MISAGSVVLCSLMLVPNIAKTETAAATMLLGFASNFSPENSHPADEVALLDDFMPVVNSGIDELMFYTKSITQRA